MPTLRHQLDLERCPHCRVDRPSLTKVHQAQTNDYTGASQRCWRVYACARCGGLVTAAAPNWDSAISECYPAAATADSSLPPRARDYLQQSLNSLHTPAGAVMLAASAVDAMLKAKAYKNGSLYSRIDKAAEDHVITNEMAQWAHEVRLDANEQRHADEAVSSPSQEDARRCVDFAVALGQFMFVLPARVEKGISEAKGSDHD